MHTGTLSLKVIDFPWYNMKCSGEIMILRGIVHVLSCFPLHFMLPHYIAEIWITFRTVHDLGHGHSCRIVNWHSAPKAFRLYSINQRRQISQLHDRSTVLAQLLKKDILYCSLCTAHCHWLEKNALTPSKSCFREKNKKNYKFIYLILLIKNCYTIQCTLTV